MFKVRISQNKELIQLEKTSYQRRSDNVSAPRCSSPRHLGAVSVTAQPAAPNPAAGEAAGWDPSKLLCLHHPPFVKGFGERGTAASEVTAIIREDLFQYVLETV